MRLVLLHGMGQNPSSWQDTISNLPSDWETYTPQLFKNKGLCTYGQIYEEFVRQCEKFTEPFHLGGVSLGAILACQYAIDYPEKVKSLLLIAVQLNPPKYLLQFQQLIFSILPKSYFRKHGLHKEQLLLLGRSIQGLNLKKGVQQLKCPAIAICGGKDRFNQQASKDFTQIAKDAQYVVIPKAGHEVNIEQPKALADEMVRFMSSSFEKSLQF